MLDILGKRTKDVEVKQYCVSLLSEMGSFDYTLEVLSKLQKETIAEIDKLGGNAYMEKVLNVLFQLE